MGVVLRARRRLCGLRREPVGTAICVAGEMQALALCDAAQVAEDVAVGIELKTRDLQEALVHRQRGSGTDAVALGRIEIEREAGVGVERAPGKNLPHTQGKELGSAPLGLPEVLPAVLPIRREDLAALEARDQREEARDPRHKRLERREPGGFAVRRHAVIAHVRHARSIAPPVRGWDGRRKNALCLLATGLKAQAKRVQSVAPIPGNCARSGVRIAPRTARSTGRVGALHRAQGAV